MYVIISVTYVWICRCTVHNMQYIVDSENFLSGLDSTLINSNYHKVFKIIGLYWLYLKHNLNPSLVFQCTSYQRTVLRSPYSKTYVLLYKSQCCSSIATKSVCHSHPPQTLRFNSHYIYRTMSDIVCNQETCSTGYGQTNAKQFCNLMQIIYCSPSFYIKWKWVNNNSSN